MIIRYGTQNAVRNVFGNAKQKYRIGFPVTFWAKQNTSNLHLSFCLLKHNFYDQSIPHPTV